MNVSVLDIRPSDSERAVAPGVVYDVVTKVDTTEYTFKVLVTVEEIGALRVPCARFCDAFYKEVFKDNQTIIPRVCQLVTDVYSGKNVVLPV